MSIKKLQGEIFQLGITLRDTDGNDVNPSATLFSKIDVFITSRVDGKVYAKFSTVAQTGFTNLPVLNGHLIMNIPASATLDSPVGYYDVQVDMHMINPTVPGRVQIVKKKGVIYELKESIKG